MTGLDRCSFLASLTTSGWISACALRQSELSGFDWLWPGPGARGHSAIAHGGVEVVLAPSKTSQQSEFCLPIARQDMQSLVPWLLRWVKAGGIQPGTPLLRQVRESQTVSPHRRSGPSMATIVRRRILQREVAAGTPRDEALSRAARFRGHSAKAGMIISAALRGTPERVIRQRSSNRSSEVCAGYIRVAQQLSACAKAEKAGGAQ